MLNIWILCIVFNVFVLGFLVGKEREKLSETEVNSYTTRFWAGVILGPLFTILFFGFLIGSIRK